MTREEAGRRAEVMQHYADGGEVEAEYARGEWSVLRAPEFEWPRYDYRKAQPSPAEPTYRPYANAAEAIADGLDWVREKEHTRTLARVVTAFATGVCLHWNGKSSEDKWADLLANYTKPDGTPCGIKEGA